MLLSYRIKYNCAALTIGSKKGFPKPDIMLAGIGIQPNHAKINRERDTDRNRWRVFIVVANSDSKQYTFINGNEIEMGEPF